MKTNISTRAELDINSEKWISILTVEMFSSLCTLVKNNPQAQFGIFVNSTLRFFKMLAKLLGTILNINVKKKVL